jgi:soluble lytic murein transglycosylase-like protein
VRLRALVLVTLLVSGLPSALAAQGRWGTHTRQRTSAEVIARRIADAEARERQRVAWAKRRPGITIAASVPAPAATRETVRAEGATDPIAAVAADLRELARRKGLEKRLDEARIAMLAPLIVSEADGQGIPPALVVAIIQLESEYNPQARSSAGATGLMQVMPSWPGVLGFRFGSDLTDEATNVRYGTWVLRDALDDSAGDAHRALLRYNGCKTGSNTPNCFSYPDRIRALVESVATATCGGLGWEECVAGPLRQQYESGE